MVTAEPSSSQGYAIITYLERLNKKKKREEKNTNARSDDFDTIERLDIRYQTTTANE